MDPSLRQYPAQRPRTGPLNMSTLNRKRLSREDAVALQTDLDAVRDEVMSSLGEKDVAHIRHMIRRARGSAIAGRALIGLGFDPITFIVGVAALAHAKIIENMEICHNGMNCPTDRTNQQQK